MEECNWQISASQLSHFQYDKGKNTKEFSDKDRFKIIFEQLMKCQSEVKHEALESS